MTPTIMLQSQPVSRSGRKPRRNGEGEEPGKKPKKVNSEIRKQQNRIASRNYREKRKRKLQYLQQLLKDSGPSDSQHTSQGLEASQDLRARSTSAEYMAQGPSDEECVRSLSAEYISQGPPPTPPVFPVASDFTMASRNSTAIDPTLAVTSTSYNSMPNPTTQAFSTYEPAWNPAIYDPPPPVSISSWNVPSGWMPTVDYAPHMASRPEDFQYTPPPTQQVFEQLPTPPQHPQELVPNPELFLIGSYHPCRRQEAHSPGIQNYIVRPFTPKSPGYV